jgi:hypothetical protein
MPALFRSKWRLLIVALVASFAVLMSSSGAFANEPGEVNFWTHEREGGTNLQSSDTVSEARGAGVLVSVWRGETDNHVWVSVNNQNAFTLDINATNVAPRVVYLPRSQSFDIFHTGTNGHIYYAFAYATNMNAWQGWYDLTGNYTNQSVSLAATGNGLMVAYRGVGNDTRVFSTWYDGNGWGNPTVMSDGRSDSAPVVTWNPVSNRFFAVIRGHGDNRVYMASQSLGGNWGGFSSFFGARTTNSSPVIAAVSNGGMMISVREIDNHIWFLTLDSNGNGNGWQQESQHWSSYVSPFLSVAGSIVYILLTGEYHGDVYWKQAWNGGY